MGASGINWLQTMFGILFGIVCFISHNGYFYNLKSRKLKLFQIKFAKLTAKINVFFEEKEKLGIFAFIIFILLCMSLIDFLLTIIIGNAYGQCPIYDDCDERGCHFSGEYEDCSYAGLSLSILLFLASILYNLLVNKKYMEHYEWLNEIHKYKK